MNDSGKRRHQTDSETDSGSGAPSPARYSAEDVDKIRKEYDAKLAALERKVLSIEKAVNPKSSEGSALRMPGPLSSLSRIEKASPRQLIDLFGSSLAAGQKKPDVAMLTMAWGTLFSSLFLSSSDLQIDIGTISSADRDLLRAVIRDDCTRSGKFVFSVIKKGANLDRSALVMIADLGDFAGVEQDGETAISLLIKTCDKSIRPFLIEKAGKKLLAGSCDSNGVPVLFTIFGLGDLSVYDIDAIERVFSKEELKKVVPRNGLGRNALDAFTEIATRIRENLAHQRKSFLSARSGTAGAENGIAGPHEGVGEITGVLVHVRTGPGPEGSGLSSAGGPMVQPGACGNGSVDKSIRILIVDDSKIIRSLLLERLQNLGYENVIQAESGDEAVVTAKEEHPSVIFMDINMPGQLDGIEAAREIRKDAKTRIIFLTSSCNKETLDRAKGVNPQGYILKPFSERDIRVALSLLH